MHISQVYQTKKIQDSPQERPVLPIKIRRGNAGTRDTLQWMRVLIRDGKKNPVVIDKARSLVKALPQKDDLSEIKALHAYVRDNIRYVKDIRGVETLQTPQATLEIGQGDCDDKSILLASLLEAIGYQVDIFAVGTSPFNAFDHVLILVELNGEWIPAETTEPVSLGWLPSNIQRTMRMRVDD